MIYTIIGDLHAKPDNLSLVDQIFNQAESLGNDCIWLGDLQDGKELIRGKVFNHLFKRFKKSKLDHILLVGNHDYFNVMGEDHGLKYLGHLSNVFVIDPFYYDDTQNLLFVSYQHDPKKFEEIVSSHPTVKAVFCHHGFNGFDMGGTSCKDASDPTNPNLLYICGHFHKNQEEGTVIYPGACFSHSHGETNQEKFIYTFDSETLEMTKIPTNLGLHFTFRMQPNQEMPDLSHLDLQSQIRFICEGTEEQINLLSKQIKTCINPNQHVTILGEVIKEETEQIIQEDETQIVQFSKWATEIKHLSEEMVNLGSEILKVTMDKQT